MLFHPHSQENRRAFQLPGFVKFLLSHGAKLSGSQAQNSWRGLPPLKLPGRVHTEKFRSFMERHSWATGLWVTLLL